MPSGGLKGLGDLMALGAPSGAPAGDGDGPDSEGPTDKDTGSSDMLVGAAHDVMSAIRSRDPESFAAALKDFVSMC